MIVSESERSEALLFSVVFLPYSPKLTQGICSKGESVDCRLTRRSYVMLLVCSVFLLD